MELDSKLTNLNLINLEQTTTTSSHNINSLKADFVYGRLDLRHKRHTAGDRVTGVVATCCQY